MSERIVIVGGGHAGVGVAAALRQRRFPGDITLVTAEETPPYHRPPLSKGVLTAGEDAAEQLLLRPRAFYGENAIDLRIGTRVSEIDRGSRTIALGDGDTLHYDHLVLATGTRARLPPINGIDRPGVHALRTLDDALAIGARLTAGSRLVILGAGYIGLEVAAVARARGLDVTLVEREERPLARVASPLVSEWARARHAANGAHFILGASATEIDGDPAVSAVVLSDGRRIEADTVLLGIGAQPVTDLAERAHLALGDGILVDPTLRTEDARIFAIGDCARYPCAFTNQPRRIESIQNAQDQAKAVAAGLTGAPAPYEALPWFWSDQGADRLQSAGVPEPDDDLDVLGDAAGDHFTVLHRRNGVIVASESMNDAKGHMRSRRWIKERARNAT